VRGGSAPEKPRKINGIKSAGTPIESLNGRRPYRTHGQTVRPCLAGRSTFVLRFRLAPRFCKCGILPAVRTSSRLRVCPKNRLGERPCRRRGIADRRNIWSLENEKGSLKPQPGRAGRGTPAVRWNPSKRCCFAGEWKLWFLPSPSQYQTFGGPLSYGFGEFSRTVHVLGSPEGTVGAWDGALFRTLNGHQASWSLCLSRSTQDSFVSQDCYSNA